MLYELYTVEKIKNMVCMYNKILVGTGYELIYKEAEGENSRDTLKLKDPNGKYKIIMQFNTNDNNEIRSFGTFLKFYDANCIELLQEQEAKYQQTKEKYREKNIKKRVKYDNGFMRVANDFPGFSFVNKTKYAQPVIMLSCISNIINKILKGEII